MDDAGHDKSLALKTRFLALTDEMLGHVVREHDDSFELVLVFTGDHTTPLYVGDHTYEPVPFAITTISAVRQRVLGTHAPPQCKPKSQAPHH